MLTIPLVEEEEEEETAPKTAPKPSLSLLLPLSRRRNPTNLGQDATAATLLLLGLLLLLAQMDPVAVAECTSLQVWAIREDLDLRRGISTDTKKAVVESVVTQAFLSTTSLQWGVGFRGYCRRLRCLARRKGQLVTVGCCTLGGDVCAREQYRPTPPTPLNNPPFPLFSSLCMYYSLRMDFNGWPNGARVNLPPTSTPWMDVMWTEKHFLKKFVFLS